MFECIVWKLKCSNSCRVFSQVRIYCNILSFVLNWPKNYRRSVGTVHTEILKNG